jgi:tRNA U34 2-thiouridine synthase MnmA/TrmU
MFKKAKQYADKEGIKIIATGEVLGERPMSQHNKALKIIEEESGLQGKLLRPLSAKLLEETEAEKQGIVNREKLFDIQGRQRIRQIELAKKYNINYPQPAGGCLLCEKNLKARIQDLLKNKKVDEQEVKLLAVGRHSSGIILGRNERENLILEKMKGIVIIPKESGPTALVKDKKDVAKAKELIQKYSRHKMKGFEIRKKLAMKALNEQFLP